MIPEFVVEIDFTLDINFNKVPVSFQLLSLIKFATHQLVENKKSFQHTFPFITY